MLGPQYNIQVHSTHETVTLVATSTKPSSRIIAKITCENHPGRHHKILKLAIPTSLTFTDKKSHGLLGQFWNVKATVRSPECEDFSLFYHSTKLSFPPMVHWAPLALFLSSTTLDSGTTVTARVCIQDTKKGVLLLVQRQTTSCMTFCLPDTNTPNFPWSVCKKNNSVKMGVLLYVLKQFMGVAICIILVKVLCSQLRGHEKVMIIVSLYRL